VVGCLDERGYLADDPVALARVEATSRLASRVYSTCCATATQAWGARARHCLALRLDRMPTLTAAPTARVIVMTHLTALASGRIRAIGDALRRTTVAEARDYTSAAPAASRSGRRHAGTSGPATCAPTSRSWRVPGHPTSSTWRSWRRSAAVRVDADLGWRPVSPAMSMADLVRGQTFP
jgi:hypothetical protein